MVSGYRRVPEPPARIRPQRGRPGGEEVAMDKSDLDRAFVRRTKACIDFQHTQFWAFGK